MDIKRITKNSFSVIGKEGSTKDGDGFIEKLWNDANSSFNEVEALAKRDENGNIEGFWGLMTDFTKSFSPWENDFSEGLYLAGVEVNDDAQPPEGWTKWTVPSYELFLLDNSENNPNLFRKGLKLLVANGLELAGAVHDFNNPKEDGKPYIVYPIAKL